jgi:hypothetical protein
LSIFPGVATLLEIFEGVIEFGYWGPDGRKKVVRVGGEHSRILCIDFKPQVPPTIEGAEAGHDSEPQGNAKMRKWELPSLPADPAALNFERAGGMPV